MAEFAEASRKKWALPAFQAEPASERQGVLPEPSIREPEVKLEGLLARSAQAKLFQRPLQASLPGHERRHAAAASLQQSPPVFS
jgi:hypothetical protein